MLVGNVHLVAGSAADLEAVLGFLEGEGIGTTGNPDLYVREYHQFGIDEARQLSERAAMRSLGGRRVFVIAVDGITSEAQNALLKTLEEPRDDALFVFIHPAPETLIATVRSRSQLLSIGLDHTDASATEAKAFLKATPEKRLDLLKPLLEKGDDDKRDLGSVLAFLSALERELESGNRTSLHAVYRARRYIGDRGALVKPLLEQVALLV